MSFFAVARVEDLQRGVWVRGKKVIITHSIINDFLEIRYPQELETFYDMMKISLFLLLNL